MVDYLSTPHRRYLTWAQATVGLSGRDVLEVGGCTPVAEVRRMAPRSWVCFNLDEGAVADFNRDAQALQCPGYRALAQDAASIELEARFEVAYSINSFEHIRDLATTLARIRSALVPGGALFTVFGPIWSADVGHHLSIPTERGPINMFDGVLEPWEHLSSSPGDIYARLEPRLGAAIAQRVIEYVFSYPDLNRLSEADYLRLFAASGLTRVLLLRRRSPLRTPRGGGTRTRELLWLARKGKPSVLARARAALGFAHGYVNARRAGY